jgi:hypothetical protein
MAEHYEPKSELRDGMRIDWDARITMFGRELRGSGPYWHELPGDRDRPGYNGQTSLHSEDGQRPYLLLPLIPAHP